MATITTTTGGNFVAVATFLLVASTSYGGVSAQVSPPAPLSTQVNYTAPTASFTVNSTSRSNTSTLLSPDSSPESNSSQPLDSPPSPNSPPPSDYFPASNSSSSDSPSSSSESSSKAGLTGGAIAGICVGTLAVLLVVAVSIYFITYKKRNNEASGMSLNETGGHSSAGNALISVTTAAKSVEYSYEELANATDNFSSYNKIGQGAFGAVYYAELRDKKAAIKKMNMTESGQFRAELNVLTRVHHQNLVRLFGYCVERFLFLVYEYIENGNLSEHLHGSGREPLPWFSRVQIALDSARALEYIHDHTMPVYIHRDIKSANILIDKNLNAKVADFGLSKLTEVGGTSFSTARLVGTFGYMSPEYLESGRVSPKVDVYAFGVVLYELISAKKAVSDNQTTLVTMFEGVLNQADPTEDLRKLVDPRLANNYPIDSVCKMAQLAKACTQKNPQQRPSMKHIVVALMTALSSNTGDFGCWLPQYK